MNITREEVKAIKTLMQDGDQYTSLPNDVVRCDNCYGVSKHDKRMRHVSLYGEACEVGIIEKFLDKHPEIKTDMDVSTERVQMRQMRQMRRKALA